MARDTQKPDQPSHEDLWNEIRGLERQMRVWVASAIGSMAAVGFAAFAAVWQESGDQRMVLGAVTQKVEANSKIVEGAIASQARVEQRLDEIARFLREDSREQRGMITDHVKTMHSGAGR